MKSFKKVSLVIAAALAGTILAVPSANAVASIAVTISGVANTTSNSVATPAVVTVPSDNTVDTPDAVKYALTSVDTGTIVSVSTTNAFIVPVLHTSAVPVTSFSGTTTYSVSTGTGTTAEFYVYTKTTAVGTVVITNNGTVSTFYVKGTAGPAYNINPSVALSVNTSSVAEYSTIVTDVFGNVPAATTPVVTVIGATISVASGSSDTITGISKVSVTYPATAGQAAVGFAITATDVVGLPAAVKSVTKFVTVSDLATSNASLTAQLAASVVARAAEAATAANALAASKAETAKAIADAATAKVAADKVLADEKSAHVATMAEKNAALDDVAKAGIAATSAKATVDLALATAKAAYKAEYNALATKWNKANPKAKVALKK